MPNWKKVIVSGSNASLNSLIVNNGITGSLSGTSSWAENALTSSNILGGTQYYVPLWDTNTSLASSYLYQSGSILKTIYSGQDKGLTLDYNINSFILGNAGTGNNTYIQVYDGGSVININTPNYTYFAEKVGIRIIPTNPGLAISGSLEVTGPGTTKFINTNVQITGSLGVSGGITGSLFGTASWAVSASSALYTVSASSALYAVSSSHAVRALSSSYAAFATSASNAATASSADYFNVRNALTASGLRYPTTDGLYAGQTLQTDAAGTLSFNDVKTMYESIRNGETTTLVKGTPVYVSGSQGASPIVYRADAANPLKMPVTYVVAEDIATAATGRGIVLGLITGIDLTGYTAGQEVFVAAGGGWTTTRPTGSAIVQVLGIVTKPGNGGQGLVLNPGPTNLPNLQSGYVWVGNSSGYPTAQATSSIQNILSASYASNAELLDGRDSLTFANTSSNTFTGTQYISDTTNATSFTSTAALYTDGGLRVSKDAYISGSLYANNLTVFGTASIQYVTKSVLVGGNSIILNTDEPVVRFAGIYVYDSGSNVGVTGSLLWDGQRNHWIYTNPSGSTYNGGMLISGPRNLSTPGDEQGTLNNVIVKGQGGDHITSSQIIDDGTTVSIPGNLVVTGSIIGSLIGTASWATNALTASSADNFIIRNNITASNLLVTNNTTLSKVYLPDLGVNTPVTHVVSWVPSGGQLYQISASLLSVASASASSTFNISSSLYSAQGSSIGAGTTTIASISTGSYRAGFFDYTVYNAGNARAGTVMSAWNGSTVKYTDNSTTDIGATNSVTMSVALNGGNVELRTTAGTTWTVRTTYRLI